MIARHDLVLRRTFCLSLSFCHCLYFFTFLAHLFTLHLFQSLTISFSFRSEYVYLFLCHLFIVFLNCCHSIAFVLLVSLFFLCYSHPSSFSCMHTLFLNLSLVLNLLLLFFSILTIPPLSLPLPLTSFLLLRVFIPLSQHHMCHRGKHRKQWSLLNNYHAKQFK